MKLIKMTNYKLAAVLMISLGLAACDTDFSDPVGDSDDYSAGDADFSNFVALGDSLTAGFADNALYLSSQQNSYPAILAQQFALVGGGSFSQPLMSDNLGGLLLASNPIAATRLVLDAATSTPESIAGVPTTEVTSVLTGSFNNMGVPGAKSYHLVAPNYGDPGGVLGGTANPYFARFASSTTTDMITDAASQLPSFYVLWIGNNDILSYATSGGIGVDQTGTFAGGTGLQPSGYGSNDITDPEAFAAIYSGLLAAMNTTATGGVLVNIPDVSAIPYFTTVPYNAVPLDQTTADTLNSMVAYGAYNAGLDLALATPLCVGATGITQQEVDARKITFAAAPNNAVVIEDESLTDLTVCDPQLVSMRQATANDLIVLPSSSKIGTLAVPGDPNSAWGVGVPLEDGDVLIPAEITAIDTARAAYNATISAAATADPNLILLDAAAIIDEINDTGINYGTGSVTSDFATGGAFSLDGVHPTARGYAIAANRMIDAINTGFNANIPPVDPGTYTTIFIK